VGTDVVGVTVGIKVVGVNVGINVVGVDVGINVVGVNVGTNVGTIAGIGKGRSIIVLKQPFPHVMGQN